MSNWTLATVLATLHDDIQDRLEKARKTFAHPVTKGDVSEGVWLELFQKYLPKRYSADKAFIVDSLGKFSEQIDVVVFDRQYSPFILNYEKQTIIPAESVYAVFEAKQTIDAKQVAYAKEKISSVRKLHRTSLPIPHAGGVFPAKPPQHIHGGILTFESEWSPPLGQSLIDALNAAGDQDQLDLGCVAAHGYFVRDAANASYEVKLAGKPATAFLFRLISELQLKATVPMIDVQAYTKWLAN
jgi:uncharacterized protein DUF6602